MAARVQRSPVHKPMHVVQALACPENGPQDHGLWTGIRLVSDASLRYTSIMAKPAATTVLPEGSEPSTSEPLLEPGDRLSRDEFERRYERMPHVKKAELIEGIVYMPSPLRAEAHGKPDILLSTWLGAYMAETPGVHCYGNSTVRLDLDNEPQPDLVLIKSPTKGGQAKISADDYLEGAPELVVEIVASSQA